MALARKNSLLCSVYAVLYYYTLEPIIRIQPFKSVFFSNGRNISLKMFMLAMLHIVVEQLSQKKLF